MRNSFRWLILQACLAISTLANGQVPAAPPGVTPASSAGKSGPMMVPVSPFLPQERPMMEPVSPYLPGDRLGIPAVAAPTTRAVTPGAPALTPSAPAMAASAPLVATAVPTPPTPRSAAGAALEARDIYYDKDGLIVHLGADGKIDGGDTAQREGWYWLGVWLRQNTPGLTPWQTPRKLTFEQVLNLLEPNGDGVFYRHPKLPPWN